MRHKLDVFLPPIFPRLLPSWLPPFPDFATAMRRTQVELDIARAFYFDLYDLAPVGYCTISEHGLILQANLTAAALLGVTRGALIKKRISQFILKEDQDIFYLLHRHGIKTGKPQTCELRMVDKGGSHFWVRLETTVGKDPDGETVLNIVIINENERKQVEEALRLSEQFNKSVINSLTAHIAVLDQNGVIIAVNEAWKNFARENGSTDPEAYLGDSYFAACETAIRAGDQTADQVDLGIHAVIDGQRSHFSAEYPCNSPTQQRWFSITVIPLREPIRGVIIIHQDITESKQAQQSLEASQFILKKAFELEKQLARIDPITGVHNRRYLYELAEREFEISQRYQQPLSVLMFDIDHFKKFNDTFGHMLGDQILKVVTDSAVKELRSADTIGRYGGDEYIILLPMTNTEQAYSLAERIRMAVAATNVQTEKGDIFVTLSIGIVEKNYTLPLESVEEIFKRADEAMYAAKKAGRNRTVIGQK
jgi:diguanylate cyclase (GGDEF)-like protein/PAS domain S-box-containing protein